MVNSMTDEQIMSITFPIALVFIVGLITGGIVYNNDNNLDSVKQKYAFDLGCIVKETNNTVEYNCNDS